MRLLSELTPERTALQYIETLLRYLVAAPSDLTIAQTRAVIETAAKEKQSMLIAPAAEEWPQQGIQEGREEGKRQLLIELLAYRFRPPDADLLAALGACTLEQLSVVSRMILDAGSAAMVRQRAHALLAR